MLKVESIKKSFAGQSVLDDFSLSLKPGEITSIVGKNGSGKSTLVNILAGLHKPDEGQVSFLEQDLFGDNTIFLFSQIEIVFQDTCLFINRSIKENFLFFGRAKNIPKPIIDKKMEAILKKLNLYDDMKKKVSKLSGGMRQKVSLGLAFLSSPKLLVIDEVSTGLDVLSQSNVWNLIEDEVESGCSVLFVSHDPKELIEKSDNIYMLHNGQANPINMGLIKEKNHYKRLRITSKQEETLSEIQKSFKDLIIEEHFIEQNNSNFWTLTLEAGKGDIHKIIQSNSLIHDDSVVEVVVDKSHVITVDSLQKMIVEGWK